ncbi:hypothetical protein EX30DRAFT_86959 [Ascodesmis nigricans]|uniref:Uncharacterized protein n=1 Tax=Ascodesmis nigricans TaxID=341454 RepID=A0A4S2N3C9_9PEZI|nr:hypothetical protein EX30DRAFT_86959 [Ascodesmis nigricans]
MPNDQHLMAPERPKGHFRFSDTLKKMKLPRLRSKGSIRTPPATSEIAQCSDTEFLSDPEANSSGSSAIGSTGHCTDVTSPSSASRLSLRSRSRTNSGVTPSDGARTTSRPKSGSVGSSRRYSILVRCSVPHSESSNLGVSRRRHPHQP